MPYDRFDWFDLVTTFDVAHDLADPVGVPRAIRAAPAQGGGYPMVEPKVSDCLEENTDPRSQGANRRVTREAVR